MTSRHSSQSQGEGSTDTTYSITLVMGGEVMTTKEQTLQRDIDNPSSWKPLLFIDSGNKFAIRLGQVALEERHIVDIQTR